MWSTLVITSWAGIESTEHVTGLTVQPGKMVGFHTRDLDTGNVVYKEPGKPQMSYFWLESPQAGVPTVKKIEVLNASGAVINTLLGHPPAEEKKPAAKKPGPRKTASKR